LQISVAAARQARQGIVLQAVLAPRAETRETERHRLLTAKVNPEVECWPEVTSQTTQAHQALAPRAVPAEEEKSAPIVNFLLRLTEQEASCSV